MSRIGIAVASVVASVVAAAVPAPGSEGGHSPATPVFGPLEFSVTLPHGRAGTAEPLVATGASGRGDTVFVWFEKAERIRFGWCSSEYGTIFSPPVPVAGAGPHRLRISMGSLQPDASGGTAASVPEDTLSRSLLVQFDGRMALLCVGRFQPIRSAREIAFGANRVGVAFIRPFFTGTLGPAQAVPPGRALTEAFQLDRWMASAGAELPWPGAVRVSLRFARDVSDAGDPIVVTGRTGAGDFVYVQTLDRAHVRFGFDHWAIGGALSAPVATDLDAVHDVVLTLGALYGPGDPAAAPWRRRVAVWLDGHRVFTAESACHPTAPGQIVLGCNPIGGSTTGALFRGRIFKAEAVNPAELEAMDR